MSPDWTHLVADYVGSEYFSFLEDGLKEHAEAVLTHALDATQQASPDFPEQADAALFERAFTERVAQLELPADTRRRAPELLAGFFEYLAGSGRYPRAAAWVEWIPELLYEVLKAGFKHKGFSFIRVLQRCPHFMQDIFTQLMTDPANVLLLTHEDGMPVSDGIARLYKTQEEHDPSDIQRAREISAMHDKVPIGILYRNPNVPTYDEIRAPERAPTIDQRQDMLESAFDKFGIFPTSNIEVMSGGNGDGSGDGGSR